MSALDEQIGGYHYKNFKIQPIEFSYHNKLGFIEGDIVKRLCRYQTQEDPLKDLNKIKHEIDLIIEMGKYHKVPISPALKQPDPTKDYSEM